MIMKVIWAQFLSGQHSWCVGTLFTNIKIVRCRFLTYFDSILGVSVASGLGMILSEIKIILDGGTKFEKILNFLKEIYTA